MNQKENQVQKKIMLHPEVVLVVGFIFNPTSSLYAAHPTKCPFDYLFALKPKNPV